MASSFTVSIVCKVGLITVIVVAAVSSCCFSASLEAAGSASSVEGADASVVPFASLECCLTSSSTGLASAGTVAVESSMVSAVLWSFAFVVELSDDTVGWTLDDSGSVLSGFVEGETEAALVASSARLASCGGSCAPITEGIEFAFTGFSSCEVLLVLDSTTAGDWLLTSDFAFSSMEVAVFTNLLMFEFGEFNFCFFTCGSAFVIPVAGACVGMAWVG